GARGAGAAREALPPPSRRGRLVRSVQPRRHFAGRNHSGVVVLSCALRRGGSGTGDRLNFCFDAFSSREPVSTSLENAMIHSHRLRLLKLLRFLKLLRWSPAPPR